jgi:cleavage stimulation factor subunit 2
VRNLNDKEVGGRPMRIDFADVDPMFEGRTTQMGHAEKNLNAVPRAPPPMMRGGRVGGGGSERQLPPNLPKGQPLAPGVGATDSISQTLAALPPNQLLDIMSQMKSLVTSSPDQARTLLNGHPQLAYALFQAMLMMNVVDATILQRILTTSGALGPEAAASIPPVAQAPPAPSMMGNNPAYQGPPPSMPPAAPPKPDLSHLPEEQRILLEQVLELSPDQIAALPPDQQEGIRQLKASLGQA